MTIDPTLEVLLANAAWVRRLAQHLLHDRAEAEEVAQEALVAGWRHPPATDRPVRGWFGQVVRNLVANRKKQGRARERREHESAPTALPTPEETTARLEVQRLIVRLVEELDEPYRHTVVLRYFEERSAEEIARAQGIPAGTVRWRLKVALDRLRQRLREGQDDSDGWRARLAVLALPRPDRSAGALPWLLAALAGTAGLVLVAVRPERAPSTVASAPEPPAGGGQAPVRRAATADRCPATLARLRQELVVVEAELRRYGDSRRLFDEAAPSPAAQAAIAPLVDRLLGSDAGGGHTVECRIGVCRVVVLAPTDEAYEAMVRPLERPSALAPYTWQVYIPRTYARAVDPLSGEPLRRYAFELALKDPEGGAVAGDLPPAPALPQPATAAACHGEVAALEERLRVARPERDRVLPAAEQFARRPPNPSLTRRMREEVQRSAGAAFDRGIECHGAVCRLEDFELAGHMGRDPAFMKGFRGPWRDARGAYFKAAASAGPNEAADFLASLLWERGASTPHGLDGFLPVSMCRPRSDGKIGQLRIHLVVPATGELNADGEAGKISAHLDGDGLETPFGRCLAAEIHKRIDGVAVPAALPTRAEKEIHLGGTIPAHPR